MPEYIVTVLPYLLAFAGIIGFLSALAVGVSLGMSLVFLQAVTGGLRKFHINMDAAQQQFEKLQLATQAQVQSQARMIEAWRRQRKETIEDDVSSDTKTTEGRAASYPSFRQEWRATHQPPQV